MKLVLFGRGVGEGILCNYGPNQWIIVDSCYGKNKNEKKAAALEYLSDNNVSFNDVKLIVITHFHDDHIKGMLDIVTQCVNAKIFIPQALTTKEFLTYLTNLADVNQNTAPQQGVSEIFEIFMEIRRTRRRVETTRADVAIHFDSKSFLRICALSPSNAECDESLLFFVEQVKKLDNNSSLELPASIRKESKNNNSVTLCISNSCNNDILLGADLEVSLDVNKGWKALSATQLAPRNSASVFKIAHHGSENGFCPASWNKLVVQHKKPIGILTPYNSSSLPRLAQVKKLQEVTSALYSTSPVKEYPIAADTQKIFAMKGVTSVTQVNPNFGYIELTECQMNGTPWYNVITAGAAVKLT
ncbi:ribonuclease Z [Serratia fonticola]|uniref:Ribonuclease Z n=1 Tax=Serratia fonticola TaxID=47917 RepID=A0A448SWB7_SERFO|nr:ribonuclease Z [Serratia fonticola]